MIEILSWGSPIGIGAFMVLITASFYLFSLAIKNLVAVEQQMNKKK